MWSIIDTQIFTFKLRTYNFLAFWLRSSVNWEPVLFPSEDIFENLRIQTNLKNKVFKVLSLKDISERTTLVPTKTVSSYKQIPNKKMHAIHNQKTKRRNNISDGEKGLIIPCCIPQRSYLVLLIKLNLWGRQILLLNMFYSLFLLLCVALPFF